MSSERILVTGSGGMIGTEFLRLNKLEAQMIAPRSSELDLRRVRETEAFIRTHRPSVVINLAAQTNVNAGELERGNERGDFYRINARAASELERLSEQYGFFLIQVSTDMGLFKTADNKAPFDEDTKPHFGQKDLTWYGYTKARGEDQIDTGRNAIVRIIYPIPLDPEYPLRKLDYARIPIEAHKAGKALTFWPDQETNHTSVSDLIKVLEILAKERRPGVYHVASPDMTNPHEFISKVIGGVFGNSVTVGKSSIVEAYEKGMPRFRYQQHGGLAVAKTMKVLGGLSFMTTDEIAEAVARAEKKRN